MPAYSIEVTRWTCPKSAREDRIYARVCDFWCNRLGVLCGGGVVELGFAWISLSTYLCLVCLSRGVFVGRATVWELYRWSMLCKGKLSVEFTVLRTGSLVTGEAKMNSGVMQVGSW